MASLTAAVILAGGSASRMGFQDKLLARVGGMAILAHAITACRDAGAAEPVVVGPVRPFSGVVWTCEEPPGGGPVAAVAAALEFVQQPGTIAVLAGDLPFVTGDLLRRLADRAPAVAVDETGREQWLLGVHTSLPADVRGGSMRALLDRPGLARVPVAGPGTWDCDTPEDLERAGGVW